MTEERIKEIEQNFFEQQARYGDLAFINHKHHEKLIAEVRAAWTRERWLANECAKNTYAQDRYGYWWYKMPDGTKTSSNRDSSLAWLKAARDATEGKT